MVAIFKQATLHGSGLHEPTLSDLSNFWPWQLQEEAPLYPMIHSSSNEDLAATPAQVSVSPLAISVADLCCEQQRPYSLSSRAGYSAAASTSRSAISSLYTTPDSASPASNSRHSHASTFSSAAYNLKCPQFASLWHEDDADEEIIAIGKDPAPDDQQHPSLLDPCDYMKTLLTQLASCISSISTAYAHQQAAMHSLSVQLAGTDHGAKDAGPSASVEAAGVISKTDKVMVEELESLSRLHSQLSLLPRRLSFKGSGTAKGCGPDMEAADQAAKAALQLRRYEGIIARFHDEITKKEAVVEALKETLAKSMLKGEKLQRRLRALEAKRSSFPPQPLPLLDIVDCP